MAGKEGPITYASTGVDYAQMDPIKRLAQGEARETSRNVERFGFKTVEFSRGESAFIIDEGDRYSVHVIEGLGTKNLVADAVREEQQQIPDVPGERSEGFTYYDVLAQDTVAMIVNDLITVGADPVVVNAYWASGDSKWFTDEERAYDLAAGWRQACDLAGAVWGGGETPSLKNVISPSTADLAGSGYGIIKPKERLTLGDKLVPGDAIFLIESSGIHANGLTLARTVASKLKDGYATVMPDSTSFGEALLRPTIIYAALIRDLFEAGVDIHYMVNITGHGWRKLMRASKELTYIIERVPQPQLLFRLIQEQSGNSDEEMYGNFNMGAGFAVFIPENQVELARKIGIERHGLRGWRTGRVIEGSRKVVIEPKGIVFKSETLGVR